MKRILIHTDDKLFADIKRDINRFIPRLEKMKTTYEALEMGTFTSDVMTKLKNNGSNSIETEFYQLIKKQLDAAGITLKLIRQNMINGSENTIVEFKNAFREVQTFEPPQYGINQRPVLNFRQISYNNKTKVFEIDAETQGNILETYCRIYLDNENEKNIYDSLQNFVKAQYDVKNSLAVAGYKFKNEGYEIQEIAKTFLTQSPTVSVKPDSIKYASGQRAQKERTRQMLDRINKRV